MKYAMFQRLLWKEYRAQRGFWLGVAGMAFVVQLITLLVSYDSSERTNVLFYIAVVLPVFYVMGSAAVTFAAEREDETWHRLRILAASPGRLFLAKFGFSLVSTFLMVGLLGSLAWVMAHRTIPDFPSWMGDLSLWMLSIGDLLLWGIFFSLMTRRVLSAVCMTPVVALTIAGLADYHSGDYFWTIRLAIVGLLLVVNYRMVRPWLKSESFGFSLPGLISLRQNRSRLLTAIDSASPSRRLFKRLKWQERQQAKTVCLTFVLVGVPLIVSSYWTSADIDFPIAYFLIPLVPFLCGVWVFRGEQEGKRFRFLVEQGAAPQTIWLSKQRVWMTATLGIVLLFVLSDLFASYYLGNKLIQDVQKTLNGISRNTGNSPSILVFLFVVSTYSIGQFVSMLFFRSVTAAFVGFVFYGLFMAWHSFMIQLNVPLIISVWPIPLVLLLATYVRSADWMLERTGWRPWLKLGSALLASVMLVVAGVGYYRVTEIEVTPELKNNGIVPILRTAIESPTAEERQTADMYRRAKELVTNISSKMYLEDEQKNQLWSPRKGWEYATPEAKAWLEENQDVLLLALEASRRESCALIDPTRPLDEQMLHGNFGQLHRLMLTSARKLESEDKLDEAWARYLASLRLGRHHAERAGHFGQWTSGQRLQWQTLDWLPVWIAHPAQTKERLVKALKEIQRETDNFPSPINSLKIEYWHLRNTFLDREKWYERLSRFYRDDKQQVFELIAVRRCFPWEETRTLRLLDEMAYRELNIIFRAEQLLNQRGTDLSQWIHPIVFKDRKLQRTWKWQHTTPLINTLEVYYSSWLLSIIDWKTKREATLLTLALVAYRKEHGELPQRLDQLVGEYFDELPLDVWSGREFGYRPEGFPTPVQFSNHTAEPGQPLLWSANLFGAKVIQIGQTENGLSRYRVVRREGLDHREYHRESRFGRAFPIPE